MQIVSPSPAGIEEALAVLRDGGIIIHATETCYGIACDLRNLNALTRLFDAKKRPFTQPVSALMAKKYLEVSPRAQQIIDTYLPGPLTIILPAREDQEEKIFVCPHALIPTFSPKGGGDNPHPDLLPEGEGGTTHSTIGLRLSSHSLASTLVSRVGSPLATTSANLHGKENPYSLKDILAQYGENPPIDLFIDSGEIPIVPPSTVIEVQGEEVIVRRQGDREVR
jgi:L-threonylcarbamoyladenylate synthase